MSNLKNLRLQAGLSQGQLAEKSNLNVRTIQHYEQGSKNLNRARLDTLLKLTIALDCTLYDLIDDEEYLNLILDAKFK